MESVENFLKNFSGLAGLSTLFGSEKAVSGIVMVLVWALRLVERKRDIINMPSSERDDEECDATGDDSSTGDDSIIIIKFTIINAFQFEILKFNNFQAQND